MAWCAGTALHILRLRVASVTPHRGAYRAAPAGKPKAGLVVIQEIFGVNQHIRAVCDRFAKEGYVAVPINDCQSAEC